MTRGIRVSVEVFFEGTYFKDYKLNYSYAYQITIYNQGKEAVHGFFSLIVNGNLVCIGIVEFVIFEVSSFKKNLYWNTNSTSHKLNHICNLQNFQIPW